jgi:hypothetical protein
VLTPALFPLSCTSPMTCEDPGSSSWRSELADQHRPMSGFVAVRGSWHVGCKFLPLQATQERDEQSC